MENKHRKLLIIWAVKRCNFMPKMYQNMFCGWAPPGPARGPIELPQPPSRNGGLLLRGRRRELREGMGMGRWREGGEGEKTIPPQFLSHLSPDCTYLNTFICRRSALGFMCVTLHLFHITFNCCKTLLSFV